MTSPAPSTIYYRHEVGQVLPDPSIQIVAAVAEIRRLKAEGVKQIDLARRFGVSPMTISRAVRGESWQ